MLAASDTLQFSFDHIKGHEAIANGVFTHYLIEGLRDAVRKGQDYAPEARKALHEMADTPQHRQVHKALDEVLAEFEGQEVFQAAQTPAVDEKARRPGAYAKRGWVLSLVVVVFLGVGMGVYFLAQTDGEETGSADAKQEIAAALDAIGRKAFDQAGEVFRDTLKSGGEGPKMVVIPAGKFKMGSPSSEPERDDDEWPQHEVRIERPFAIGQYEVTFEEYERFAEATGRRKPDDAGWGRGRRPVINVSWDDAVAYAQWLSAQTGATYRLPSEAEWEYAARAGTETPFHFGERITTDQANFNGNSTYNGSAKGEYRKKTVAVGSFPANAFGLHDVHGNVWEWVQDCWHDDYKGALDDGSAWESGECAGRSLRGGSWSYRPGWVRSAYRFGGGLAGRFGSVGFRLARTLLLFPFLGG